jgi:LysR family transcriptional regulator, hydrogen peroxide-inducible genes activator
VQKLEDELGERLFERLSRRARLTPAGEAFVPRAARILDEVEAAQRELMDAHDRVHGRFNLGVIPTIAPYLLPRILPAYTQRFPEVELIVNEEKTERLLRLALACEVDLSIASLPMDDARFETETLFEEELKLAIPEGHRLLKKKKLRAADLEEERFVLMKDGHCLGDQVLSFCQKRDLQPSVTCRSAQIETLQTLVSAGLGISLVPDMACHAGRPGAPVYMSLEDPKPHRTILAAWPKNRPLGRPAREFLKLLRATV